MLYFLGIDLGQRQDPTALALVRRVESGLGVVGLERVPLGTPYPEVVARLARLTNQLDLLRRTKVVVDATGVGAPVVEAMRRGGLNAEITAVTITGGDKERHTGLDYHVPKQDLMTQLQVLLEKRELKISRALPEAGALVKELVNMQARPGARGRLRVAAEGMGEHDDLVMALALAVWRATRNFIGMGGSRLPGI
jgi:hypothetical protein